MKTIRWTVCALSSTLPLFLSGCFLLSTTRKLPIPIQPDVVRTATPEELIAQINDRWQKLETLNATVDIQASVTKSQQGLAKDYTTFRGVIALRKSGSLRVHGSVPVVGLTMFDMASDGDNFTLYVPSKSKVIKGKNSVTKKSDNQLENLRPQFFFDAMVVRGLAADDDYMVARDSETIEDARRKRLVFTPEYVLSVMRRRQGGHELTPARVITIDRTDMLPYQQDLYDNDGNLVTQVVYSNYQKYDFGMYPGKIVIKRNLEDFQLTITVEKVNENMLLSDDVFKLTIPANTQTQTLE